MGVSSRPQQNSKSSRPFGALVEVGEGQPKSASSAVQVAGTATAGGRTDQVRGTAPISTPTPVMPRVRARAKAPVAPKPRRQRQDPIVAPPAARQQRGYKHAPSPLWTDSIPHIGFIPFVVVGHGIALVLGYLYLL
ncbi:MAG: hypothetical protein GXP35_13720 [Actinobacteria bacterium]|nr:hypothetical protein [Actinomycetota bacterium]